MAVMSKRLDSQMKDFSDITLFFPAAKGAFVLILANRHSVFSQILISQSELVHCGNVIRHQSIDCKSFRKASAALRN